MSSPSPTWEKVVAAVIIFLMSISGTAAAHYFHASTKMQRIGSLFGGGVFLGAGFIHLLGDSIEDIGSFTATLFCTMGVIVVLVLEEVSAILVQMYGKPKDGQGHTYSRVLLSQEEGADQVDVGVEEDTHSHVVDAQGSPLVVAIVLWIALSFHAFTAGVSLGVQDDLWEVFYAVIAHKTVASYALGTSILKAGTTRTQFLVSMLSFACVTPTGVAIGAALRGVMSTQSSARVLSFGAGTFIYVAFVECIGKELHGHNSQPKSIWNIVAFVCGWGTMALIGLVE